MVFLRLTVKVYPRDQTSSSASFFRSFLGDRDRDDSNRNSVGATAGKPVSFLIVLEQPEEVTLGGGVKDEGYAIARAIDFGFANQPPTINRPLDIKKLLDDDHESDDLDTDMTVADVFVDNGKARADGLDQRRTVRVIQKPAPYAPTRFPSVTQDWGTAAQDFERLVRVKKEIKKEAQIALQTLQPIMESRHESPSQALVLSDNESSWSRSTSEQQRREDVPLSSVEKDHEIPGSPSHRVLGSPMREEGTNHNNEDLAKRMASQELGDWPPSSRPATPTEKPSPVIRDASHSQVSVAQSATGHAPLADSPALQLERESGTHSISPQKVPGPGEGQPKEVSTNVSTSEESDVESTESDESDESSSEDEPDQDGDVTMQDEATTNGQQPSPATNGISHTAIEIPSPRFTGAGVRSRKRKNSQEHLEPNKEPRLAGTTSPPKEPSRQQSVDRAPETPMISPTTKKSERTSSFSGVGRRLSFSGRPFETSKPGLGLGITKSPAKKPSGILELSQGSAETSVAPTSTPIPSSSAPTIRRASVTQNISTPSNAQTPADKAKHLHSALRKDSPAERHSEHRSVSFVDEDDIRLTGSGPPPRSTPLDTAESPKSTPVSRPSGSQKRLSNGNSMNFPTGVTPERLQQIMQEVNEKMERQNREKAEFEEKIKEAEGQAAKSEYLRKLKEAYGAWQRLLKYEKSGRQADKTAAKKLRPKFEALRKELEKLEASSAKTGSSQATQKHSGPSVKPSQPKQRKDDSVPQPMETPPLNGAEDDIETVSITQVTPWKAINRDKTPLTPNGTGPRATLQPKPTPKPSTGKSSVPVAKAPSSQSQSSNGSDDLELPSMGVQARRNSTPT
ncbi:hypothetical protein ARAM_006802, partial [Aspergillus rambellii]